MKKLRHRWGDYSDLQEKCVKKINTSLDRTDEQYFRDKGLAFTNLEKVETVANTFKRDGKLNQDADDEDQ